MSPPSADVSSPPSSPLNEKARLIADIKKGSDGLTQSSSFPTPLHYSGTLDHYESFDVTSVIGREYPKLQLSEILGDDAKLRDLAILGKLQNKIYCIALTYMAVSQRGVLFFRNQDIEIEDQKILGQKLGELTGKPSTSKVSLQDIYRSVTKLAQ